MKETDAQLIKEIDEHIKETNYPGSCLNCGVYPIDIINDVAYFYYPKKNCIMKSYSPEKKEIIKNIYTLQQAIDFVEKL